MIPIQHSAGMEQTVDVLKFLSDGNRLRILVVLAQAETCVCDLIDDLALSQTLVSYHLGKLRKAGLVRVRREAQWNYYSLDPEAWTKLIAPLSDLFALRSLPLSAAYGASRRCDNVATTPKSRAVVAGDECCLDEMLPLVQKSAPFALNADELDVLTGEVLSRLISHVRRSDRF